jgi:hypothetical protein
MRARAAFAPGACNEGRATPINIRGVVEKLAARNDDFAAQISAIELRAWLGPKSLELPCVAVHYDDAVLDIERCEPAGK